MLSLRHGLTSDYQDLFHLESVRLTPKRIIIEYHSGQWKKVIILKQVV